MKHVVSVSLGSTSRDAKAEVELLGERFTIERRGADGDLKRAAEMIAELDGKVDAIGLGGIDLYLFAGGRRYTLRDAKKMAAAAVKTPVVDGSGLKNSLERWVVRYVQEHEGLALHGKRVVMTAAVDRFGMAEELAASGCTMLFGDLIFGLGVPIPLRTLRSLAVTGRILLPVVSRLPFRMLYPTGEKQEGVGGKNARHLEGADVIAGDFLFIKRHLPTSLSGKIVITNTVTPADVELLFERGLDVLVTTTPSFGGRSFGTNVIEAALVAVSGKRPEELSPADYIQLLQQLEFRPRVERRVPRANGSFAKGLL